MLEHIELGSNNQLIFSVMHLSNISLSSSSSPSTTRPLPVQYNVRIGIVELVIWNKSLIRLYYYSSPCMVGSVTCTTVHWRCVKNICSARYSFILSIRKDCNYCVKHHRFKYTIRHMLVTWALVYRFTNHKQYVLEWAELVGNNMPMATGSVVIAVTATSTTTKAMGLTIDSISAVT